MKLLLPLFLLFAIHSQAQIIAVPDQDDPLSSMTEWRNLESKATGFLNIQGGLVFDRPDYQRRSNNYIGLNYINLGFGRQLEKEIQGIELDYLWFDEISAIPPSTVETAIQHVEFHRKKQAIDLSMYRVFKITGGDQLSIFVGPLVALGLAKQEYRPYIPFSFSTTYQDVRLGIGAKVNVQVKLSERLFLSTGTKVLLTDFSYHHSRKNNPSLPIRNQVSNAFRFKILRSQFYLPIGLTFMLGK